MPATVKCVLGDAITPVCASIVRLQREGVAVRTGTHLLCATSRARNHEPDPTSTVATATRARRRAKFSRRVVKANGLALQFTH